MFLAGVDIVGDKLMEVNVFSPGGLGSAGQFTGVDFAAAVIDVAALEAASKTMDEWGVTHGEIYDLVPFGIALLPFRDPDGIQLELTAPL
jgi:hypothetical protein